MHGNRLCVDAWKFRVCMCMKVYNALANGEVYTVQMHGRLQCVSVNCGVQCTCLEAQSV